MLYIICIALTLSSAFLVEYSSADDNGTDLHWINLESILALQSEEWAELVAKKDAAGMAARYTEDCVFIVPGRPIARGRNDVHHRYTELFNGGLDIVKTDVVDSGRLGDDYIYMVVKSTTKDDDNVIHTGGTNLIVFRKVEDGYQTFLDSHTGVPPAQKQFDQLSPEYAE